MGSKWIFADTPTLLTLSKSQKGYYRVNLHQDGVQITVKVCLLVLEAFVGPKPENLICLHGPQGQWCDKLSNLEWGTVSKNLGEDKIRDGTDNRGEKHVLAKLTKQQVLEILSNDTESQAKIASKFGICRQTVSDIKTGKRWAWLRKEMMIA